MFAAACASAVSVASTVNAGTMIAATEVPIETGTSATVRQPRSQRANRSGFS